MKPRPIGIVAGGGSPIAASFVLREIISECQKQYNSWRSYEYPCINLYSYPYSEMLLVHNTCSIPSRELSFCIQQLKLIGMEMIVVPCFTMSSYLTYRSYGVELVEMGAIMQDYLEKNNIKNPLVLCSDRTRKSGYCDKYFECHYPDDELQQELGALVEEALRGKKIDIRHLLDRLPDVPILCGMMTISAQLAVDISDPRWIDPAKPLAQYVVHRSYQGSFEDDPLRQAGFIETQRDAASIT